VITDELSTLTQSKSSSFSRTLVLPELIAFDQVAAFQLFPGLGILRDHPDPVAGLWVDQIEPDPGPVMASVI